MPTDGRTPSTGCITTALAILAMVVALPFVIGALTGDDGDDGDESAAPAPQVTTTTAPPAEDAEPVDVTTDVEDYAVTYRVEIFSGDAVLVDTEVRTHASPFEAEVRLTEGEPGTEDAPMRERTSQVMGGFETASPDQEPTVLTLVPGPPARIGHFGGDLAAAVDQGVIEPVGRRLTVASLECDVYRTKSPLDVTTVEAATDEDYTDLCIAPDGLVLREEWHTAGELFRRRTAVDVDRSPVPDDAVELTGHRLPEAQGGGRVRQLQPDATAPDVDHLLPDGLPEGFEPLGRYVYVADAPEAGATDMGVSRIVSIVDVFVSDGDVLVIENGGTTAGSAPVPDSGGIEVEIPGVEGARALVHTPQNEVVFSTGGSRFVRLTSTLPLDRLTGLAQDLVPVEGSGEVTPLDDRLDITGRLAPEDMADDGG